jgi:hypothetical protein
VRHLREDKGTVAGATGRGLTRRFSGGPRSGPSVARLLGVRGPLLPQNNMRGLLRGCNFNAFVS